MTAIIGNSCIMFAIMETNFAGWLNEQMLGKGINQSQLSKRANLNQAAISRLLSGKTSPTAETCKAIARALRLPVEEVYRAANLLPPIPENDQLVKRAEQILNGLNPDTKKQALTYLEYLLQQQDRGEHHAKKNTGPLESNPTI